jgi:hypothetical protein
MAATEAWVAINLVRPKDHWKMEAILKRLAGRQIKRRWARMKFTETVAPLLPITTTQEVVNHKADKTINMAKTTGAFPANNNNGNPHHHKTIKGEEVVHPIENREVVVDQTGNHRGGREADAHEMPMSDPHHLL